MSPVQEFNEQEVLNQPDVGHIFLILFLFYFIIILLPRSPERAGKVATCVEVAKKILTIFLCTNLYECNTSGAHPHELIKEIF